MPIPLHPIVSRMGTPSFISPAITCDHVQEKERKAAENVGSVVKIKIRKQVEVDNIVGVRNIYMQKSVMSMNFSEKQSETKIEPENIQRLITARKSKVISQPVGKSANSRKLQNSDLIVHRR